MGCSSCTGGAVAGCKNNGGCQTGGCNKQNSYDWLSDMQIPIDQQFNVVEVRFKGGRKDYFRNNKNLELNIGDAVVVNVPNGHHIGFVAMRGELVRLQMKNKQVKDEDDIKNIYRIAQEKDLIKFEEARRREMPTMYKAKEIIREEKLEMKLNDVEYQADGLKATFFYSAEDRVDFRVLIKKLASEFHIRVDMRQISSRQEAGRLGGIGSCGRELCCSTWINSFKSVSTSAARYQNLSLNPSKLTGQCGRLKCCLNYELDTYVDALKNIPKVEKFITTARGKAFLQKTDIFNKIMWFSYPDENTWIPVEALRVFDIIEQNKQNKTPFSLITDTEEAIEIEAVLNNDLVDLDKKFKSKKQNNQKGKGKSIKNRKKNNKNQKGKQNIATQNKSNPNNRKQNKSQEARPKNTKSAPTNPQNSIEKKGNRIKKRPFNKSKNNKYNEKRKPQNPNENQ